MKNLVNALIDLLKVKSLITLSVVGVLMFLTVKGNVDVSVFMGIASSVITYYFTRNNNVDKKPDESKDIPLLEIGNQNEE